MPNLIEIFSKIENQDRAVTADNIISMNYGVNKKTGAKFAKATLEDGRSFIRTITNSGVVCEQCIQIPSCSGKDERNQIINDLHYQKYTQDEIASFLGVSQATVSNVLNKA